MRTVLGIEDESQPNKRVASVYHSLAPLERTGAQVQILRNIIGTAQAFVFEEKSSTQGADPTPEARKAGENTLVLAFHQLDNILDDQIRWGGGDSDAEKEVKAMMKAETDRSVATARLHNEAARPFTQLRAKIYRTPSGKLCAVNDTESVVGFGDTAFEAMEAFDTAFYHQQHLPTPVEPVPVKAKKPPVKKTPAKRKPPKKL